jgi:heterodisulfide reductase subunit B
VAATEPKRVAYYKGCLASLSAKELDISTQALAPQLGFELDELESVTCCGAGDIHEAEPDYYLHLNARILAYAEATGCDTLMTICNVCTLNLRQANWQLKNDDELRARVREALRADSSTSQYASKIAISVRDGVVTLRGIVDDLVDSDNLLAVAEYVEDVDEVVDELRVRGLE